MRTSIRILVLSFIAAIFIFGVTFLTAPEVRHSMEQVNGTLSNRTSVLTNHHNQQNSLNPHNYPKGLQNLMNTCYMSSVLQVLFRIIDKKQQQHNGPIMSSLFQLKDTKDTQDYQVFKQQVEKSVDIVNGYDQQDAHEFFIQLLNALYEEQEKYGNGQKLFESLFEGTLVNKLTCQDGHVKQIYETFKCQSLSFPSGSASKISLEDMLINLSQQEIIDDLECERCNKKMKFRKTTQIESLPQILALHLVRFNYFQTHGQKITTEVSYDEYMQIYEQKSKSLVRYRLLAAIKHSGKIGFGHYYLDVRDDEMWYEISDQVVKKVQVKDKQNVSQQVYMLFYERV